jgi:hypothetical protein
MQSGEFPHILSEPLIENGDFQNVLSLRVVDALVPGYTDSLARSVDDAELEGKEQASIELSPMYDFDCRNTYVARMRVAHIFQQLGFTTEEYYKRPEKGGSGDYGLTIFWGEEAEARKLKIHAPAEVQSSISPSSHPRENYVPPETEENHADMVVSDGSPEARAFKGLVIIRDIITGDTIGAQG